MCFWKSLSDAACEAPVQPPCGLSSCSTHWSTFSDSPLWRQVKWPFVYILFPLLEQKNPCGCDSVLFILVLFMTCNKSIRANFLLVVGIQHMFVEWGTQRHCKRWNLRYAGTRTPCIQLKWTRSEGSLSSKANAGPFPEGIYPFLASASKFPLSPSCSPLDLSLFAH